LRKIEEIEEIRKLNLPIFEPAWPAQRAPRKAKGGVGLKEDKRKKNE